LSRPDCERLNGTTASTRRCTSTRASDRIKPGIRKLRLPQVDPPALDRFYTALRKSGSLRKPGEPLSASRLRDVHAVISGALALAARYGWIAYNPATLVRPPAPQSRRSRAPALTVRCSLLTATVLSCCYSRLPRAIVLK
jgi:hypothetical protein